MSEMVSPQIADGEYPESAACIHAKLQLQLVVPEECLVRGDIGAWYACLQCGEHFRSDIKPYKMEVTMGIPERALAAPPKLTREQVYNSVSIGCGKAIVSGTDIKKTITDAIMRLLEGEVAPLEEGK